MVVSVKNSSLKSDEIKYFVSINRWKILSDEINDRRKFSADEMYLQNTILR